MDIAISIYTFLFVAYCAVMLLYRFWHNKLQPIVFTTNATAITSFSIIIPARNEANNIGNLLHHLLAQNYSKQHYEIIVVDDFSTDDTAAIVKNFSVQHANIKLLQLQEILGSQPINSYKKKAIELAIAQSKYEWIITTDADCTMPTQWLESYNNYICNNKVVFVAAPVAFTSNGSWLHHFQQIDFMALQGITAAAVSAGFHAMCNGANVAYSKQVFYEVNGFAGIDAIASGDDMLLMNKIKKAYPNKLGYLYHKNAIVSTAPMDSIGQFINQRIRWASKTHVYKEAATIIILWLVLSVNIGLLLLPLAAFVSIYYLYYWLLLLLVKTIVEALFAKDIAAFFSIPLKLKLVLLQYPHIAYTSIAGILGLMGTYSWKGRKVQ